MPTSAQNLCRNAAYLAGQLRYSSLIGYIDAVRWLHIYLDLAPPPTDSLKLKLVLRGLKRTLSAKVNQKLAITPAILQKLRNVMDLTTPLHKALFAIFTMAFFTFFRRSNIVPPSRAKLNISGRIC